MASNLKDHEYSQSTNADNSDAYVKDVASGVHQQVREKPISSVAIAVGAGIGAGLLLTVLFSSERSRRERFTRRVSDYLNSSMGNIRSGVENALPDAVTDRWCS